jgi:hypothetical protein
MIAMFTLSIGTVSPAKAYPGTNIYVNPSLVQKFANTTKVGDTFTVTLAFGNMTNLFGMQYTLYWKNSLLNVSNVHDTLPGTIGSFVATNTTNDNYNATYGQMSYISTSTSQAFSGSATFRTITFKIVSAPAIGKSINSTIAFGPYGTETVFGDNLATTIPATAYNGEFLFANPVVSGPPVTSDNYDGLWHTKDFTITLTATGGTNGITNTFFKINGGPTQDVNTNGQPSITTEGKNNTLEYWSVDGSANVENHHFLQGIKLDKTAPTGSIAINNGANETTSASVTLTLTATDNISGVDKIKLSNNADLSSATWTAFSPTQSWQLTSGDGNKTVYYQIRDVANLSSVEYSASIILNTTALPSSGEALNFNGVDQYVSVPAIDSYVYTFDLWFNPSSNYGPLIGSDRFRITVTGNCLKVWYDVNKPSLQWSKTIAKGQWHNLIVVIDYRVWKVTPYLDGAALGPKSTNTLTKPAITKMEIGSNGIGGFYSGTIDEFRIYNQVLSGYTAKCHYNNATGYYGRPETGLVAGWHFDESKGNIAADYSGNGRNATIYGATWVDGHILLPNPRFGDTNGDGKVNLLDLIIVSNALRDYIATGTCDPFADTNGDGAINILDMINISRNLGNHI